jgi:hypothetical protein
MSTAAISSLVDSLELSLDDTMVCPLCLGSIAVEIDHGDAQSLREALCMFVPLLWDEGLDAALGEALERASRGGVPGAAEALIAVERQGVQAPIVRPIVLRLAGELSRRMNATPRAASNGGR